MEKVKENRPSEAENVSSIMGASEPFSTVTKTLLAGKVKPRIVRNWPASRVCGTSVIVGASIGLTATPDTGTAALGSAGAAFEEVRILKMPPEKLVKIFVPFPSLASAEPETKLTVACPCAFGLKVILKIAPEGPVKPGLGSPPEKVTEPAALEKVGSVVHKVKMDVEYPKLLTSNLELSKFNWPDAALMDLPAVFTLISIENISPVLYAPVEGVMYKVAAFAAKGKKTDKLAIIINFFIMFL